MTNKLKVEISAVDKITSVINRINESLSKLTRPISNLRRDMGNLNKAANGKKLADSLRRVGKAAMGVVDHLRNIAAPMLALIGGGTLAGLYALTTEWAQLGFQIGQTALTLGISTQALQAWRGAAQVMGISAAALDGGMKALGDTIEDALYGRNAQALVLMNKIGLSIHRTKDGAIDTTRALLDLSRGLSRIKSPQVQGLVARNFGVESLLPLLRQGPAAIAEYQRRVQELGGVMSGPAVDAAERFGISLNYLHIAAQGLKNSIGAKLIPILQPLIEQLTQWISLNRELIAMRIANFVQGLADWLKQVDFGKVLDGATKLVAKIDGMAQSVGGWKNVAIGFGAIMTLNMIAPILTLTAALVALAPAMAVAWPFIAALAAIGGLGYIGANIPGLLSQAHNGINVAPGATASGLSPSAIGVGTASMAAGLPAFSVNAPPAVAQHTLNVRVSADPGTSAVIDSASPGVNIGYPYLGISR